MASLIRSLGVVVLTAQAFGLAAAQAPGPTQPNIAPNCNKWFLVKAGDSCATAEAAGGITADQFFQWNPDVSRDCVTNFWGGYAYCIGVGAAVSTTTSKTSSTTSKTSSSSTSKVSTTSATTTLPYSTRFPVTTWNITTRTIGTDFPPKETQAGQPTYCIDWHFVTGSDSCQTIVNRYATSLRMDDLLDWNPGLLDDCSGLQVGFWVCIRIQPEASITLTFNPTGPAVIPTESPYTPTTFPPVDTSFTPTPTQGPLPRGCLSYYLAKAGDRCDQVLAANPEITREQFFAWNPYLNGDCGGLWADNYYCVAVQGVVINPETVVGKPSPTPVPPSASNCAAWYETSGGDDCDLIVAMFGRFKKSDFISWNPAVKSDCSGIEDDIYYCVGVPGTPTTRTDPVPTSTVTTIPRQTGIAKDCVSYWQVSTLDTCDLITGAKGITLASFLAWNPAVGTSSCDHLLPGYEVCVAAGAITTPTGTTTTSKATTTTGKATTTTGAPAGSTPTPVQDGMVRGCQRFYKVQSGDGCWAITNSAGISLDNFYAWNPSVKTDCTLLLANTYVCIGISGPATTISSGPPVPT